jgi:hypothetical protein
MFYKVAGLAVLSFLSSLALASEESTPAPKPLEERLQIVGTIAQKENSGATQGVVIFRLDDQRTVFGTLGKAFEIDQQWYYVVRIDGRHAAIANVNRKADDREFEILYINPPSSNTLIYEAQPDTLNASHQEESAEETVAEETHSTESKANVTTVTAPIPTSDAVANAPAASAAQETMVAGELAEEAQPVLVDEDEPTEVIESDVEGQEASEQMLEESNQ